MYDYSQGIGRASRPLWLYSALALALILTQVVFVPGTARASNHDVTGLVIEDAVIVNETAFVEPEQWVWNDASGGTFTLTYQNQTTGALNWAATQEQVEAAIEALSTVDAVTVTGSGDLGDEWKIQFVDPANPKVGLIATDSLTGGSSWVDATPSGPLPIDPSGIAYLSNLGGNLLIADSEIEEEPTIYDGVNLWEMTTAASVIDSGTTLGYSEEPTGLAYNSANQHLFVSDDVNVGIWEVTSGGDGTFGTGDDTFTFFDTSAIGVGDPEDVAWDPTTVQIFVAGGEGDLGSDSTVTPVFLGANGVIGGGDDVVGTLMDFSSLVEDLEGLTYRAETDTLLLADVSGPDEKLVEVTKGGRLVRTIDVGFMVTPADIVIAPASGGGGDSVYVVDRRVDNGDPDNVTPPQDGRLYELSVPFNNLRPYVDAGHDQSITIGDPLTLTGDSYDDDQTTPLTFTWTQLDGPGTATFGSPNALSTSVNFSAAGGSADPYVLQLESSDGSLDNADIVEVQVFAEPITNQAPSVSAGPDQTITLPGTASLSGTASDDGLPDPPGLLTLSWSKVSGPGAVTFGDSSALSTTASFSTDGTYTLRLTADDGSLQSSDDVVVTVTPGGDVDTFIDDNDSIFEADIEWMAAEGITKGCNPPINNMFCPDDFVTRGQMAAFLVRAFGYTDGLGADLFVDDDGSTFENDIDRLGTAGVTKGCNPPVNDEYCPDDFVTRGQMAAFLHRALG